MSTRGRDWSLLGGVDPTPGDVDVIDYIVTGLETLADAADTAVAGVTDLGLTAGTGGWEGLTADAFTSTLQPVPGLVTDLGESYREALGVLRDWSGQVADLQAEADLLLAAAEEAEAARAAAEAALPGARADRLQAKRALDQASEDGTVDHSDFLRWDRAATRVWQLETDVTDAEADLAALVEQAAALADTHQQAALGVAGSVTGATLPETDLLPFAVAVAAIKAADALGHPDIAGDDGIISHAELAQLVTEASYDLLDQELDASQERALANVVALAAQDTELSGALVAALGVEGVLTVLYNLNDVGRNRVVGDGEALAEAVTELLAAGSMTADGFAVLAQLTDPGDLGGVPALILATIEGIDPRIVALVAHHVVTDDWIAQWSPFGSALFPGLEGDAATIVLTALNDRPDAIEVFLGNGLHQRLEALIALHDGDGYPGSSSIADLVTGVLAAGLVPASADAQTVAAALIEVLGDAGHGRLDLELPILLLLSPHLPALTDNALSHAGLDADGNPISGDGFINAQELEAYLAAALDGLSAEEVQQLAATVVAIAIADAPTAAIPGDNTTLGGAVGSEIGDLLTALQGAIESKISDVEAQQAAFSAAVSQGLGLVTAIGNVVFPASGAVTKLVVSQVQGVVTDFVGDQLSDIYGPDDVDYPSPSVQAAQVSAAVLPELLEEPTVLAHLEEVGSIVATYPPGQAPSVPTSQEHLHVQLADGSVVQVTEGFYDDMFASIANVIDLGGEG